MRRCRDDILRGHGPLQIAAVLFLAIIGFLPGIARADDFDGRYEAIYGARFRQLRSNAERVQMAQQIAQDAVAIYEDEDFSNYLFKRAIAMALDEPGGGPTALWALTRMGQVHPNQQDYCNDRRLQVIQDNFYTCSPAERPALGTMYLTELVTRARQKAVEGKFDAAQALYHQAEEAAPSCGQWAVNGLANELKTAKDRFRITSDVKSVEAMLQRSLNHPAAARKMVHQLLIELDQPAEAVPYLEATQDTMLQAIGALAAKNVTTLTAVEAHDLGRWYAANNKGVVIGGPAVTARIRACYTQFLAAHPAHDADWLEAKSALDAVGGPVDLRALANVPPATQASRD